MSYAPFIHLKTCSSYSLLKSTLDINLLPELAAKQRMPALAITDLQNLFGALEFTEACCKQGVQPIIGCQLNCRINSSISGNLTFLVQNRAGYENLLALCSQLYLQNNDFSAVSLSLKEDVLPHNEGLIVLSGGHNGLLEAVIQAASDKRKITSLLKKLQEHFPGRFYIELQRQNSTISAMEACLLSISNSFELPIVATNDCLFPEAKDFSIQQVLTCIGRGERFTGEAKDGTPTSYFRSPEEMVGLFSDLPEAIENSLLIAQRCSFGVPLVKPCLPKFPVEDEKASLRALVEQNLDQRLQEQYPDQVNEKRTQYQQRLEHELNVINQMGYAGYFLIVADFVQFAKNNQIAVGPGRGSGAGSVVAWLLGITAVDPLRFNLIFERFLNPERVSLPDFDIDFCQEKRDQIISYLQRKYGADHVAQIITFGTMQPRAAVRDVSRVMGIPYSVADRISKLMPFNPNKAMSIADTIASEPQLQKLIAMDSKVKEMLQVAGRLEGIYRHASTHAAGVVIGNQPLRKVVALYSDKDSQNLDCPTTQGHMKSLEKSGLVKFDLLGLKTLTILDKTMQMVNQSSEKQINLNQLNLADPKTFDLFRQAQTVSVFQFESPGMRALLRDAKPTTIDDLVALVALYRPGPMENIGAYLRAKSGKEKIVSLHPAIDEIVAATYGVIIYQEQVMQIAQKIANYSAAQADLLRRAMGKKIHQEMVAQRAVFLSGAKENGINEIQASEIFDLLAKFASYGFNKAHATCYALLAYQTAWCKAHYPAEFLAACMSEDLDNKAKLTVLVTEALSCSVPVLPPSINHSASEFLVEVDPTSGNKAIRFALAALRNIGRGLATSLVQLRASQGKFQDLFSFFEQVKKLKLSGKQMTHLAASGAFDDLVSEQDRGQIFNYLEMAYSNGNKGDDQRQGLLFSPAIYSPEQAKNLASQPAFTSQEKCAKELETLGFYLSEDPLTYLKSLLPKIASLSAQEPVGKAVKLFALISKELRMNNRGERFATLLASKGGKLVFINVWQDELAKYNDILKPGALLIAQVQTPNSSGGGKRFNLSAALLLDDWLTKNTSRLRIFLSPASKEKQLATTEAILHLLSANQQQNSGALVQIQADCSQENYFVSLPASYLVHSQLVQELAKLPGVSEMKYKLACTTFQVSESN